MSLRPELYPLPRDAPESARLKQQHEVWKASWGFLIHPSIHIRSDLRIADVATGTGAWLIDVASQVAPSCECVGFDISTNQFPPSSSLPPNVTLHQHNVLHPFPEQYLGTFDVVNIRLIVLALQRGDWGLVLHNLITLLRPGGCLQWFEADFNSIQAVALKEGASTEYATRLARTVMVATTTGSNDQERDLSGATLLLNLFKQEADLEDCREEVIANDHAPDTVDANNSNTLLVGERLLMMGGVEGREELVEGVRKEFEGGKAMIRVEWHLVLGRKKGEQVE